MHSPSLGCQPGPPIPCKSAPKAAARPQQRRRRSGNVLVFSVFLMIVLFAFLSLAVDVGYLCVVRTELQRTADVSAIAGAASLYRPWPSLENAQYCMPPNVTTARHQAREFVRHNPAAARTLDVDLNPTNDPSGDIVAGRLPYPATRLQTLDTTSDTPDSVRVRVSLAHDNVNDVARLFFARIWGIQSAEMSASATATTWYPSLLPFATSEENWDSLATGGAGDCYAYSPGTGNLPVASGPDGVSEIVMFPGDWTGEDGLPPGNFGIIQIGPDGGELDALRRQVDQGPSVADMDSHGGASLPTTRCRAAPV